MFFFSYFSQYNLYIYVVSYGVNKIFNFTILTHLNETILMNLSCVLLLTFFWKLDISNSQPQSVEGKISDITNDHAAKSAVSQQINPNNTSGLLNLINSLARSLFKYKKIHKFSTTQNFFKKLMFQTFGQQSVTSAGNQVNIYARQLTNSCGQFDVITETYQLNGL